MRFRTEIEIRPDKEHQISRNGMIAMLGSCFTDNIGSLLEHDGFRVVHNPLGPLYNPCSILQTIRIANGKQQELIMRQDADGLWHCLNFASRYCGPDYDELVKRVMDECAVLGQHLAQAETVIITLGTAYVYMLADAGITVGNCHKFPANAFRRLRLGLDDVEEMLQSCVYLLPNAKNVIFTVSPIRHVADGMHENQLSKSTLLMAIDKAMKCDTRVAYFPAYEIMLDDLRDYRFYAADMKHPSEVAVDYIYEKFQQAYMSPKTINAAEDSRKQWLRSAHRPIIK